MVIKKPLLFPILFISFGITTQTVAYIFGNENLLSYISGVFGVVAVVLTSLKKISMYLFSFLQLFTYMVLAYDQHLYGELAENVFYAITMTAGVFIWLKHYNGNVVETKSLNATGWLFTVAGCVASSISLYFVLRNSDDTQPFMDAISTTPAIIAQILMITRYREQWIFWLIVDVTTCILWFNANNWCMVFQYVFWTFNGIYGWVLWSKKENRNRITRII